MILASPSDSSTDLIMAGNNTPVVFIHGLWLHAASWAPWLDVFAQHGYAPVAPGWPCDPETVEEARANPDDIADQGIDDVAQHYARIIARSTGSRCWSVTPSAG